MNMYTIEFTKDFDKAFAKLKKSDLSLIKKMDKVLQQLSCDPFYKGLKTHKAQTQKYGVRYSSKVSKDIRIIWDFEDEEAVILALTIGGHSGKKKVYK